MEEGQGCVQRAGGLVKRAGGGMEILRKGCGSGGGGCRIFHLGSDD